MATCAERISIKLENRIEDLQKLWDLYLEDSEAYDEDLGNLIEYGLSWDYVPPETSEDQAEGYFRYQLSWGGPTDEFRIFADQKRPHEWSIYRIEYWFLDWFDGASRVLRGNRFGLVEDIATYLFFETGSGDFRYQEAIKG